VCFEQTACNTPCCTSISWHIRICRPEEMHSLAAVLVALQRVHRCGNREEPVRKVQEGTGQHA
jgi:hypothetical protein